jgi:hypothetical protein
MKLVTMLTLSAFAASLGGCASYPAPTERMTASQSAVRGAQEVGAQNNPQAALHLKLAQEQVDQARQLMNDGDNKRAEFVLLRGESDAELAIALAREASARNEAQKALDELKQLKAEGGTK